MHEPRSVGVGEAPQYFQLLYAPPETLRSIADIPSHPAAEDPFFTAPLITDSDTVRRISALAGLSDRCATLSEREERLRLRCGRGA